MDANCLSNFVQDKKKKKTGSLTSWFSSLHLFLTQKMMEEEVEEEEVSKVIWPPRQHYCCQLNLENSVKLFQSVLIGILITWFSTNKQQEYRTKGFSAENNPGLLSTGLLHSALWLAHNIAPLTQKSDAKGSTLKSPAQVSLNHMQFSYSCFKVLDGSLRYLTLLWLAVKMTLVFVPPLFY